MSFPDRSRPLLKGLLQSTDVSFGEAAPAVMCQSGFSSILVCILPEISYRRLWDRETACIMIICGVLSVSSSKRKSLRLKQKGTSLSFIWQGERKLRIALRHKVTIILIRVPAWEHYLLCHTKLSPHLLDWFFLGVNKHFLKATSVSTLTWHSVCGGCCSQRTKMKNRTLGLRACYIW